MRGKGSILTIATVIGVALLLMLTLFYLQGMFDHLAYSVGLNWETCMFTDGEVLCGGKLPAGMDGVNEPIQNGVRPLFW